MIQRRVYAFERDETILEDFELVRKYCWDEAELMVMICKPGKGNID